MKNKKKNKKPATLLPPVERRYTEEPFPMWGKGIIASCVVWLIYVLYQYTGYFYARYSLENMGSKIIPNLYPDPPHFSSVFIVLITLIGAGILCGFLYGLFFKNQPA